MANISRRFHESNVRLLIKLERTPRERCFPEHWRQSVIPYETLAHSAADDDEPVEDDELLLLLLQS
jgi:hypothetical protein